MDNKGFQKIALSKVPTPCHIVHLGLLEQNLRILDKVKRRTGCKILLALKGFAMFSTFPLIRRHLDGVCASGLYEARLGKEEFRREVHTFAPAYDEKEFHDIMKCSDHILFNSFSQLEKYKSYVEKAKKGRRNVKFGIRVNPEKSVAGAKFGVYDPCSENSRLGVKAGDFQAGKLDGITGLHFHALCEQGVDELETVLKAFEEKFGQYIRKMKWINFGGGHHITRKDYDVGRLCRLINDFKARHPNIEDVYLEPGEAVALNAGIFVATVLDIIHNNKEIAIIDSSVETHFPDALITKHEPEPYIPEIEGAGKPGEFRHDYALGGVSCAAGDVFGEYSFRDKIRPGDKIIFIDTAHYSMVKTNTFNGIRLPMIMTYDPKKNKLKIVKRFGYKDYKERLS